MLEWTAEAGLEPSAVEEVPPKWQLERLYQMPTPQETLCLGVDRLLNPTRPHALHSVLFVFWCF